MVLGYIFILTGCATMGGVETRYQRLSFEDGISSGEARIIAQRELFRMGKDGIYSPDSARVFDGKLLSEDGNTWHVAFRHKGLRRFAGDLRIVVNKSTGDIVPYQEK